MVNSSEVCNKKAKKKQKQLTVSKKNYYGIIKEFQKEDNQNLIRVMKNLGNNMLYFIII